MDEPAAPAQAADPCGSRLWLRLLLALPTWILVPVLLTQIEVLGEPHHAAQRWPPLLAALLVSLLLPRWPARPRWCPLAWWLPGFELGVALVCVPPLLFGALPFAWLTVAALAVALLAAWAAVTRRWVLLRLGPAHVTPLVPWVALTLLASLLFTAAELTGAEAWLCPEPIRPGVRRIYHRPPDAPPAAGWEPALTRHQVLRLFGDTLVASSRSPDEPYGFLILSTTPPYLHRFVPTGNCWPGPVFRLAGRERLDFVCIENNRDVLLGELDPATWSLGASRRLDVHARGSPQVDLPDRAGGRLVLCERDGVVVHVRADRTVESHHIRVGTAEQYLHDATHDVRRNRLYVANHFAREVQVCDAARLIGCQPAVATLVSPWGLAFDPGRDRLFVGAGWPLLGSVRVLAGEDLTELASRWFAPVMRELVLDPGTGILVASASFQGTLRLLDPATLDDVGEVDLGAMIRGLVLDREHSRLYAASTCGIYEIDLTHWLTPGRAP